MKAKKQYKKSDWRNADPHRDSESQRYEDPIPSREHIINQLEDNAGPLSLDDMIARFGLKRLNQQGALEKRLAAMVRQGQLVQNRVGAFGPVKKMNVVAGTVQAHRDGFGFLIPDDGPPDIFLPPRHMRELMNGDRALVRVVGQDPRGRPEGSVIEVIERVSRQVVGRLHVDQGISYVIPDSPRVHQDLLIPGDARRQAKHGQMVVAEIVEPPGRRTLPVGRIVEILGEHLDPGMEIEAAIRTHSLPHEFPKAVLKQAAAYADSVTPDQIGARTDLRKLPLVTIDGADARDFDDAVHARAVRGGAGWFLTVAIADVAAYVEVESALDEEASLRGNSVYFPNRVIPMLPEKLSNGLCSLNPDVDRLCMVCEMRISPEGEILRSKFFEAVMRSSARLIYEDVAAALDGDWSRVPASVKKPLEVLDACYAALMGARESRGAIDFESRETRIVFADDRKIDQIVPVQRTRAHRLIEECMISANVEAARFVTRHKIAAPYRVHEKPDAVKVSALREFLTAQGLRLGGGDRPEAPEYARLMKRVAQRSNRALVQMVLLRSLMQARYSADNAGHFGLALEHYGHFTSPIRRYPDLLLHRAIKHLLRRRKSSSFEYSSAQIEAACAHCSMTERRADEATRDALLWLKCEYMSEHVGEEFDGVVSGVAPFGLFVELGDFYVDGLVHVSSLVSDYYQYDSRHHRLVGDRSGQAYSLGDRVRVRLTRVNLDERKIDLELSSTNHAARKSSSAIKGKTRKYSSTSRPGKGRARSRNR